MKDKETRWKTHIFATLCSVIITSEQYWLLNATYILFSRLGSKDSYEEHGEQWVPQ